METPALSRRMLVAGAGMLGFPSAGVADATTDEPGFEFAFAARVTLKQTVEVGPTPNGFRRRVDISGGTFEGPRIRGIVLPGGADWQLQRADNFTVIEADYMLQADDGARIHIRNIGISNSRVPGASVRYLRTVPSFEAPLGPHAWLNQSIFIGTLVPEPGRPVPAVLIRVYRVT